MSGPSDLVQDSRLDTTIRQDGITVHTYLEAEGIVRQKRSKEYWERERRIGRGGFGQVHLQKCIGGKSEGRLRAVKILDKPSKPAVQKDLHAELEALAKFSRERYSPWFVQSFGWYEDIESIFITMEYCQHRDLQTYLDNGNCLSPDDSRQLAFQMVEALYQMHRNEFVHRDLKPGNILIKSKPPADWWIVLADFGISKRIKESHGPSTVKGTYGFLAPELMGFIETTRSCRADLDFKACDMWAAGEVIVHMLTSKPRFEHMNQLLQYCSETKPLSLENSNLEAKEICEDLIDRLMTVSPGDRIIAMEAMEHDWFSSLRNSESGISIHLPIREQKATISNASDLASNAWTTRRSEWTSEAERPAHTSRRTANAVPAKSSKGLSGSSIMQRASMNAMRGTVIKGATGDALDCVPRTSQKQQKVDQAKTAPDAHIGPSEAPRTVEISSIGDFLTTQARIGWIGVRPAPMWFNKQVYELPKVRPTSERKIVQDAFDIHQYHIAGPVRQLETPPNPDLAILLDWEGSVCIFRIHPKLALLETINIKTECFEGYKTHAMVISKDGSVLAVHDGSQQISVFKISAEEGEGWQGSVLLCKVQTQPGIQMILSPDNTMLITTSGDYLNVDVRATTTGQWLRRCTYDSSNGSRPDDIETMHFPDHRNHLVLRTLREQYIWDLAVQKAVTDQVTTETVMIDSRITEAASDTTATLGRLYPTTSWTYWRIMHSHDSMVALAHFNASRQRREITLITVWHLPPVRTEPAVPKEAFAFYHDEDTLEFAEGFERLAVYPWVTGNIISIVGTRNTLAQTSTCWDLRTTGGFRWRRPIFSADSSLLAVFMYFSDSDTVTRDIYVFDVASGLEVQVCQLPGGLRAIHNGPDKVVFSRDNSMLLATLSNDNDKLYAWKIHRRQA